MLTWAEFKKVVVAKGLSIQCYEIGGNYALSAYEGAFQVECYLPIDPDNVECLDFEVNFKPGVNKKIELVMPAFCSKTIGSKKLFARNTGFQSAVVAGANIISHTITYPWVKITGIEIIGCQSLDTVDMKVLDTSTGSYSTVPNYTLNQFGFTVNLPDGYYIRESPFDADLYQGMVVRLGYTSSSSKTLGINLLMAEVK